MFLFSYSCLDPKRREHPQTCSPWQESPPPLAPDFLSPYEEVRLLRLDSHQAMHSLSGPGMLTATAHIMHDLLLSWDKVTHLVCVSPVSRACPYWDRQISILPPSMDQVGMWSADPSLSLGWAARGPSLQVGHNQKSLMVFHPLC